jgi:arabinan endo-1,5-alpha-L-arabinosidase
MATGLTRRQFLGSGLVFGAGLGLTLTEGNRMSNQIPTATPGGDVPPGLELTGRLKQVHDPVIIKAEDAYYLFCTGAGIPIRKSADLLEWKAAFPALVFAKTPAWALEKIPGATNIWAPDISYYNDKYHLYYSVSTFGSNRSVIGLATNKTLNAQDDDYKWTDEGLVVESTGAENYNCIDPNLILDADGVPWLAFGSFWSGIKMRRLDYATGKPSEEDTKTYALAQRFVNNGSIEAPFVIHKGDFYYLFASFDFCCRGADSTYYVAVGRSEAVTGPYVDRDGVEMLKGGGTQVTFPTERWRGPGHCAILQDEDADYIVYHAYDAQANGTPTLRINRLAWDADGWPSLGE